MKKYIVFFLIPMTLYEVLEDDFKKDYWNAQGRVGFLTLSMAHYPHPLAGSGSGFAWIWMTF